jgi:hypothetical protein
MIRSVSEQNARRGASRYDAVIATFVGLCALLVSGYTAYMQRQQVRAAVWPILEFDSSNGPDIHFTIANKGVGPAIIRHVMVKVDGHPVKNWKEALDKLIGPEKHRYSESDINGHVFGAGESVDVFTPRDADGNTVTFEKSGPLWAKMNEARGRVSVEICYCSTLGDSWTLSARALTAGTTTETRRCPTASADTFEQ